MNSDRDVAWEGRVTLGNRDYYLLPAKGNNVSQQQTSAQRSQLLKFDDPKIKGVKEFEYTPLPKSEKRIRLLKLFSGTSDGSEISCELIEADYDNPYHVPTKVQKGEENEDKVKKQSEGDKGQMERSDLESEEEESQAEIKAREERQEKRKKRKEEKRQMEEQMSEQDREMERKRNHDAVENDWKKVKEIEIEYEALSWCWGNEPANCVLMIQQGNETFKKRVKRELALALKYLRIPGKQRILWIDAVCIDQDNAEERNHQVQMMSRVYTRAKQVCIWLGEDTNESKMAIDFIRHEIMELKNFDEICSHQRYSDKWQALMMLMQRDWFSRRWVVQEISLASRAVVCCGPDTIPWRDFAVAVELFVEVETATHRLSEVMLKDEKFRHVPGWFEYVSELGASLLVQATGKVFRSHRTPMQDVLEQPPEDAKDEQQQREYLDRVRKQEEKENEEFRNRIQEVQTIDPLERRSLLSLEYLVSTMFIFKAAEARDAVYAMLAIAKDATPLASSSNRKRDQTHQIMSLFGRFLEEKPFEVDYSRPYSDVCRDFVEFSVRRTSKSDPVQALDILCRPWALDSPKGRSIRLKSKPGKDLEKPDEQKRLLPERTKWKTRKRDINGNYTLPWTVDTHDTNQYWIDVHSKWRPTSEWEKKKAKYFPSRSARAMDEAPPSGEDREPREMEVADINLPQWVARASQAPFSLYHHPGMHILKTGRANPDPLVGPPKEGHRNYNAAQSQALDLSTLKFRKRPTLGHYSLFVEGFEVDTIVEIRDASQSGNIPKSWLELVEWDEPYDIDPPDDFWRTLVADRGRDNRNPPYYYARAFKESVHKGGISSGSVDTAALIKNERNSIVAEFCRRVHAVIWNRRMFKTKSGRLGLALQGVKKGNRICILYGCTVPVVLEYHDKEEGASEAEELEDRVQSLKSYVRRMERNRERKASYYRSERRNLKWDPEEWEEMMDARKDFNRKVATERRREGEAEKPAATSETALNVEMEDDGDAKTEQEGTPHATRSETASDADVEHEASGTTEQEAELHATTPETTSKPLSEGEPNVTEDHSSSAVPTESSAAAGEDGSSIGTDSSPPATQEEGAANDNDSEEERPRTTRRKAPVKKPERYYKFKGECYLHGMMDGEAVREKFYTRAEDILFELR